MVAWTSEELARIGSADELRIAALRPDGTLRKPVVIWVVRAGDELYVRSAYGQGAAWWRAARVRREGWISAAGVDRDVAFEDPDPAEQGRIDAAYVAKYRRYGAQYVASVTTDEARSTTIRLVPRR